MLIDLEQSSEDLAFDSEICVVGAGAVGLALATKLARKGKQVILLEGGGVRLEQQSQNLHLGLSVGHPFENIAVGRYRVLGGTTTFWGGQVTPFASEVFEPRPSTGEPGWPFPRKALEPYYKEAYDHVGLAQVLRDDNAVWRRLGMKPPDLGPDLDLPLSRWVPKRNFARLFQTDIRQSPFLRVIVHANVTGFGFAENRSRITSVCAKSLNGRRVSVRARHVVIANGTLEVVRLMLQPAEDGRSTPWADNQWIGRGFIDHLDSIAGQATIIDPKRFSALFENIFVNGFKYYPKIHLNKETKRKLGLVDIAGQFVFTTKYSEHLNNLKMFFRSLADGHVPGNIFEMPKHALAVAKISLPLALRYIRNNRSFKPGQAKGHLLLYCEQISNPGSEIRLSDGLDALGMRTIKVDWQIDGRELETMATFARLVREQMRERRLAEIHLDPELERKDPSYLKKVHDGIHQMSTTRIGDTAKSGVVDGNLRVHGTENLYIAGAAVFPTSGAANPTFTALALALRLGEHLEALNHG